MSTTAVAVPGRNTIFKDDIRRNAVGGSEIVAKGVAKSEVREDAVGKSELREEGDPDGGLTGAYITESSPDKVPSAASADRATSADSADLANSVAPPEPYRVIGNAGNPAFENGCTNLGGVYETAAFFKDREGMVHLRGAVTCPGTSQTAFQLPPGYRPAAGKVHAELVATNAADGDSEVVVDGASGAVAAPNVSGFFRLDGIQFRAAN